MTAPAVQHDSVSTSHRLHNMGLEVDGDKLDFMSRWYLRDIIDGRAPRTTIIKGAQLGLTIACIVRCIDDQINLKLRGTAYFFPTERESNDFSKSRWDPIQEQFGFNSKVNTAGLKEIGNGYVYFRAAGQVGGGQKSLSGVKSFPADKLYLDEYDEMAPHRVDAIRHRLDNADEGVREEVGLSTPTLPEFGVHLDYQLSDQSQAFWLCHKCNGWTCLEESWPDCIAEPASGDPFYLCSKCREPLEKWTGEWVAKHPDRSKQHRGFYLSQLCSLKRSAAQLLAEYEDANRRGRVREFFNQVLARPYADIDDQLTEELLTACLDRDRRRDTRSRGPCAMGVDVGVRDLHYVVGGRMNTTDTRIYDYGIITGFDDLAQIAKRHNVQVGVIDIGAETRKVREFIEAHPGWYGCQYANRRATGHVWDHKKRVVTVNRNDALDASHHAILHKRDSFPAPDERWHDQFVPQMLNMARARTEDDELGTVTHRWVVVGGVKNDHFKHAHGYYRIAFDRVGVVKAVGDARASTRRRSRPGGWMAA